MFPPPNITCVSRSSPLHVPHVCSCHLDYFDHPNRILYGVKILRLLSFCLVPQRPNYRPHYLIVKHLQPLSRCKVKITFPLPTPYRYVGWTDVSMVLQAPVCQDLLFIEGTRSHSHNTLGGTPLYEWSARRRDLYLTTHNTDKTEASVPPAGFDSTIPAGERTKSHVLARPTIGVNRGTAPLILNLGTRGRRNLHAPQPLDLRERTV